MPRKKSKYRCACCVHWQPGNEWRANAAGMYADGTCKPTGRIVANVHRACRCFVRNERMGVIQYVGRYEMQCDIVAFAKKFNEQENV